ncbi:MAG: undecaprenyl-phosphate glucose phosphotransferase [Hyphomicrobiaceae bacterium]
MTERTVASNALNGGPAFAGSRGHSALVRPRWSRKVAADIVGFGDMIIIIIALLVPCLLLTTLVEQFPRRLELVRSGLIACLVAYPCLSHWQLYDTRRMSAFPVRPDRIMMSTAIAMVAVLGLGVPVGAPSDTIMVTWPLIWFCAASAMLILYRATVRDLFASLATTNHFDERIAVYGVGKIAERVEHYIREAGDGLQFTGAFDDRTDLDRVEEQRLPTSGQLGDLIQAGREGRIDRIIVALPQVADGRLADITRELEQLPVTVHAVTHFSNDLVTGMGRHKVSSLGPVGLINIKERPLADWAPIIKRAEDILISASLLIMTLPVIALIAAAIKLTSRGPVLFRQRRRGLNQKVIEVLKFRSMTVQENGADVRQATSNDKRVTFVGRILRRSSLDELPQLINVLVGEMSLVGPRPHALIHDEKWGEMLEQYANRHQVKPGITGLAQVRGLRGEARTPGDIQKRISADLEYIANWSLWLDLSIIFRTVHTVMGAKNAY